MGTGEGAPFAEQHDVAALFAAQQEGGFALSDSPAMASYR